MKTAGFTGRIHPHLTKPSGIQSSTAETVQIEQKKTIQLSEPNAAEMAVNFTKAISHWITAGAPVVSQAQYDQRSAICGPCEYWAGEANLGLGKCKVPGCGCTKFKRWLATEVCKHPAGSKWPALPPSI